MQYLLHKFLQVFCVPVKAVIFINKSCVGLYIPRPHFFYIDISTTKLYLHQTYQKIYLNVSFH